jgi:hypothetical protein
MKLALIIDPGFTTALKKLMGEQLPLKTAYKLKGIAEKVQAENNKYDELRIAALNNYGSKDAEGKFVMTETGSVDLQGDNLTNFLNELNQLLSIDVPLDSISINDLGDKLKLSADELFLLSDILKG